MPSPARALAGVPWVPAAIMVAIFAVAGIAVVDDYGVSPDGPLQRAIAQLNIDYAVGTGDLPTYASDRYYGVAFEAPLILVERLLGLTDSRAIYLSRHLLTHLFFLAGGWFCYLLACRLFGDRRLALFALLLFLLHPRIYAHSFFNSKDPAFLAMFMIALYLAHHAFRRGTAAAFAACGVGVGVLINLRIMGALLFAAVAGLRALDLLLARNRAARRRAAVTTAAFVLAAAGTLYALSPYLWRDPLAIADAFAALAWHPTLAGGVFQGRWARWPSIPPHYLPTWMAISTPPATLLLCLIGAGAAVGRGIARPGSLLGNTRTRFEWLLLACLTLPIAAVAALNSNIYNGWRQMYFLYAPACLLAVGGLRALLAATRRLRSPAAAARLQRGLSALAAAALVTTAADVVRLHPNQEAYFNFLVDRRTPGHPARQWHLLYYNVEHRQALEYLLARFPDSTLYVDGRNVWRMFENRAILPAAERRRILFTRSPVDEAPGQPASFYVFRRSGRPSFGPVLYTLRIYHSTVLQVTALDLSLVDPAVADRYRAVYRAAVAREPLLRTEFGFDLYLDGNTLTWAKESCRPGDTRPGFVLRVVRLGGKEDNLDFDFGRDGVRVDGHCLIRRSLPDYPIRTLKVGRGEHGDEPSVAIDFKTADNQRDGRAAVCAAGSATPVYRNPYPNVGCHPSPLQLPRAIGLRVEGCSFDTGNNLLYVIQQYADRAFAYRDGIYVSGYDLPFPDRSVTGLASPRWQGATFLPAKYDHAMLVLANRDGSVWGYTDLSEDRIARGESARVRAAKYDLSGAQIDADVRTGQFVAEGITYDTVRDRLYLSSDGNAAAFMRNPPDTAWVRDAASDVAGVGGPGLTFDGRRLLSAQGGGVSAWTEGVTSPGISIPPEELQRLAGNIRVRGLAWDGSNLYLCDRNNNTVWAVTAQRERQ